MLCSAGSYFATDVSGHFIFTSTRVKRWLLNMRQTLCSAGSYFATDVSGHFIFTSKRVKRWLLKMRQTLCSAGSYFATDVSGHFIFTSTRVKRWLLKMRQTLCRGVSYHTQTCAAYGPSRANVRTTAWRKSEISQMWSFMFSVNSIYMEFWIATCK